MIGLHRSVVVVVVVYLRTFLELGVLPIGSGSAIRQIGRLRSSAQLKYRGMSSNRPQDPI